MKKFRADGQLKRKLKIFLGVGLVGILLVGALIIWAGVATVQHAASLGADANVQEKVRDLKKRAAGNPGSCEGRLLG